MIRLYGGRTMPCIRSSGVRIAGAWPSALIARICVGVIDDSACLPSIIERWIGVQPVGGVGEVGAELHHHRADGVAALGRRRRATAWP